MEGGTPSRLLRVDLESGTVESQRVPDRWRRLFVGGKGLGARYLHEAVPPGADPLGPENVLLFMLGPLSGHLPGEQRYAVVTKSPLTGAFLDSYAGGTFPSTLAGALGDHMGLLVAGVADRPARIEVADGTATVELATDLEGSDVPTTCEAFPDAAVACIGPAGESRVRYATVGSDGGDHHAGRGGAGAVMGSKRLKAVVARGDSPDSERFEALRQAAERRFESDGTGRWQAASGTLESVDFANEVGALSTRGWQAGRFEAAEEIGIEAAREGANGRERDDDAYPGGFRIEGEDGESVPRGGTGMSLGAGLGIDEFDAVVALGETCDRLGVDVIGGGAAIAWGILAARDGLVDRNLSFGDPEDARLLLSEIVDRRTPLGDALADGVEAAADQFGGEDLVPSVKRMSAPAYDPRAAPSMALAYATSDRGACHRRARPIEREPFDGEWSPDRAARAVAAEQDHRAAMWCLVADDFLGEAIADVAPEWLAAAGLDVEGDIRTVGERVWNLVRLFNVREGFTRVDDALPAGFTQPLEGGPAAGTAVDPETFERTLDAYYEVRGWDDRGRPTAATVDRLDLDSVADDVHTGEKDRP